MNPLGMDKQSVVKPLEHQKVSGKSSGSSPISGNRDCSLSTSYVMTGNCKFVKNKLLIDIDNLENKY